VLFFRILKTAGPTNLMLVTLLIPVTAVILGGFVLGERLSGEQVLGMALILAGLALIDGRILRPLAELLGR
jgi:drug/metabolite transporter (DMT)-like permease